MNQQWPFILRILKICQVVPMNNNNSTQIVLPFAIQTANKAGQIYPIAIQNPAI
jgi:hypothetical protein